MLKRATLIILVLAVATPMFAQKMSWRKHRKLADELYGKANYAEAAENYEAAWKKKKRKKELIFKAGESYYLIKDYRKAAAAYLEVKDENDDYPLVGLKYARCLKQDGQYEKAIKEFRAFSDTYTGDGKAILQDIISNEIKGCELGLALPSGARSDLELLFAGTNVNTDEDEFAPFPVSNNQLYFSSSKGGKARIYVSTKVGKTWARAAVPANFPVIQNGHFANGSFSPDGDRYYFTICNAEKDKNYGDLTSRCELFVTKKSGNQWSRPERLPDYVNLEKITSTHPTVVHRSGLEIVYFASNRDGTRGGMDIWFISRDLAKDDLDFTFPMNLGPNVNTLGDELTPYYNRDENKLYFSSNGHISIGGFDIFKVQGEDVNWTAAENAGLPINSPADDFGYVENSSHTGGFLVSNRAFGGEKPNTRNSDIFEFTVEGRSMTVQGNVYARQTGEPIANVEVALYELGGNGNKSELNRRLFDNGSYIFEIAKGSRYEVEVSSPGYLTDVYQFAADDASVLTYGQPVFLASLEIEEPENPSSELSKNDATEIILEDVPNVPVFEEPEPVFEEPMPDTNPSVDANSGQEYEVTPKSASDKYIYRTSAPRHTGTYYKVQLAAVSKFKPNSSVFRKVKNEGRLDTELIIDRGLTRVLLADFFSLVEAKEALKAAKRSGFPKAYLVKYEDGIRHDKVR
jgi:hypothetical protein